MSTVMTPERFHTWSHHLQLISETEALITAIRSSVCQFCHRLIWGHLRSDHRDGLAVWARGSGNSPLPPFGLLFYSSSAALQENRAGHGAPSQRPCRECSPTLGRLSRR